VAVFDKSARTDGTFSRDGFAYDHESDIYLCPGGKKLTTTGTLVNDDATMLYRASNHDCAGCTLRPRYCPNTPARKVPRSIHEGARDMARQIAKSWEGRQSRRLRKKDRDAVRALKASLTSAGFDYEGRTVRTTNSSSQQPPRTFGWQS
jgi:hypothetical protein